MAFVLGFGLIIGMSAFLNPKASRSTLYHILSEDANTYTVSSTSGNCTITPVEDCRFTTDEAPDVDANTFSKDFLEQNNVNIEQGTRLP